MQIDIEEFKKVFQSNDCNVKDAFTMIDYGDRIRDINNNQVFHPFLESRAIETKGLYTTVEEGTNTQAQSMENVNVYTQTEIVKKIKIGEEAITEEQLEKLKELERINKERKKKNAEKNAFLPDIDV